MQKRYVHQPHYKEEGWRGDRDNQVIVKEVLDKSIDLEVSIFGVSKNGQKL